MNLPKLKIGGVTLKDDAPKKVATSVTITPANLEGAPFTIEGEHMSFDMVPRIAPDGRKEVQRWAAKFAISGIDGPHMDMSDAELDALIERKEAALPDLFARLLLRWNLPVELTRDAAAEFFREYPEITIGTLNALTEAENDMGNSPNA